MQIYNKSQKEGNFCKIFLSDFFGFLQYKVDNDLLTLDEVESLAKIIREQIPISGTAEDFAGYYGQSVDNVRVTISRKYLGKPKRKVLYSFIKFCGIKPSKWCRK